MLVSLREILPEAANQKYAIPGFNIFGYEDARAVLDAAEDLKAPVILTTNKDAVDHIPVETWGPFLTSMGRAAKVPVCVHLDHTYEYTTIYRAVKAGYTSVMYDGSQLSLDENIKQTRHIVEFAHACGVSVEGEIGSVAYQDVRKHIKSEFTTPSEAKQFAEESGVDAMAVAIGTIHRLQTKTADIQFDRLAEIEKTTSTPLVIHGTSGIREPDLTKLKDQRVAKFNIGTDLRIAFGQSLQEAVTQNPEEYDRLQLFKNPMDRVREVAKEKMQLLGLG